MTTTLDYLRHGRPEGGRRYRGCGVDDPLSETGWAQMRATTAAVRDDGWTRVISSPMRRCRAFAEWIAGERGLPLDIDHDLREVGFGAWEGLARAELLAQRADEYHAFQADPVRNRPAGAEPLEAFGARVAAAFRRLLDRHPGEHLLVVAHAGVIRATLGHVLEAPPERWYRVDVDHAALSRFVHDGARVRLVRHNWTPGGPAA